MAKNLKSKSIATPLLSEIRALIEASRQRVATNVNAELPKYL
jgi:hypothetical protein